jgi:predicted outer membrane protein
MMKSMISALLVAAVAAANANAQALREPQTRPQGVVGQPGAAVGQPGAAAQVDEAIASCLALGNQEEIAVAQFAKDHAKSNEVKQFIEMVIKDHREALQKLQAIAPQVATLTLQGENAGAEPQRQPGATGQPVGAAPAGQAGRALPGALPGQPAGAVGDVKSQMLALQRRVTEECLQLTKKELGEHEGAMFDRCYIGQQMGAHIAMLAKLKGSEEFATGPLRQFINDATQTTERHLAKAKEIGKSLEEEATGASDQARRDGRERNRQ